MTILNSNSNYAATPPAIRRAFGIFLARLARRINGWIAAVIAHREYQANLVVLRSFGDRELKDIGLHRRDRRDFGRRRQGSIAEAAVREALMQHVL
jgi:uncharacterized protein YjiS (DUF1127 family)